MPTEYRSKIDLWLLIVLVATAVACAVAGINIMMTRSPAFWWLALLIAVPGTGLPIWLLGATKYTLDDHRLHIRSGPFRWDIRIQDIRSIVRTSSPVSSPALSLDRLRIELDGGDAVMISPRNAEDFLHDIERRRAR